jgi:hypothetical protein
MLGPQFTRRHLVVPFAERVQRLGLGLILGRGSITGLLVLLVGRRGLLLVGTTLVSSRGLIPAITFGGKTLPMRFRPAHIISFIIIVSRVTEGLSRKGRFLIFGHLHLDPNLEALKICEHHYRVWQPSWIRRMEQHPNGTRSHQRRLLH